MYPDYQDDEVKRRFNLVHAHVKKLEDQLNVVQSKVRASESRSLRRPQLIIPCNRATLILISNTVVVSSFATRFARSQIDKLDYGKQPGDGDKEAVKDEDDELAEDLDEKVAVSQP